MLFCHIHIYVPMKFHEKMLITEKVLKEKQKGSFFYTPSLYSYQGGTLLPRVIHFVLMLPPTFCGV